MGLYRNYVLAVPADPDEPVLPTSAPIQERASWSSNAAWLVFGSQPPEDECYYPRRLSIPPGMGWNLPKYSEKHQNIVGICIAIDRPRGLTCSYERTHRQHHLLIGLAFIILRSGPLQKSGYSALHRTGIGQLGTP